MDDQETGTAVATEEQTVTPLEVNPAFQAPHAKRGFRLARWHWVEGVPGSMFAGLRVELRSNLIGAEITALDAGQKYYDLYQLMAPWVRDWNYEAPVEETVEEPAILDDEGTEIVAARSVLRVRYEVLPPPAVAGWKVFEKVDLLVVQFIRTMLCGVPYRINTATSEDETPEGNSSGHASDTPAGMPDSTPKSTATKTTNPPRSPRSSKPR